jgi:hypothetical protein
MVSGSTSDASRNFGESVVNVRKERDRGQAARGGNPADGGEGEISGNHCGLWPVAGGLWPVAGTIKVLRSKGTLQFVAYDHKLRC